MQCAALITIFSISSAQESAPSDSQYLNIESQVYNDQSALNDKSNLKSKAYQDFIHTLYRKDEDNLKKVDTLFGNPDRSYYEQAVEYAPQTQPTYATYIAQQQGNGYQYRRKRDVIFRPLFVTRYFAEREREREQDRILRRRAFHQSLRRRNHLIDDESSIEWYFVCIELGM